MTKKILFALIMFCFLGSAIAVLPVLAAVTTPGWSDVPTGVTPAICPSSVPGCNTPINVSGTAQTKSGILSVGGLVSGLFSLPAPTATVASVTGTSVTGLPVGTYYYRYSVVISGSEALSAPSTATTIPNPSPTNSASRIVLTWPGYNSTTNPMPSGATAIKIYRLVGNDWRLLSSISVSSSSFTDTGSITPSTILVITGGFPTVINNSLYYLNGAPGSGKVLTSDANGLASWQNPTTPINPTNNLWSQSGNNLYPTTIGNNVGIGTAAPTTKLHVAVNANMTTVGDGVYFQNVGGPMHLTLGDTYNGASSKVNIINTRGTLRLTADNSGVGNIVFTAKDSSNPSLSDVDRMVITKAGNVGIGTMNPSTKLSLGTDITEKKLAIYDGANAFYGLGLNPSGGWLDLWAGEKKAISLNSGILVFNTNGTEKMRVNYAGNVGIGTDNPTTKLSLGTDITAKKLAIYDGPGAFYGFGLTGGWLDLWAGEKNVMSLNSGILTFKPQGTEAMRISSNGNVGIGTAAPSAKLDVAGSVAISGTVKIGGGSPAAGEVLTSSDSSGNATWQYPLPSRNDFITVSDTDGTVSCPTGYVVVGSGFNIAGSAGDHAGGLMEPTGDGSTTWQCRWNSGTTRQICYLRCMKVRD
jgi:hypothetical protein